MQPSVGPLPHHNSGITSNVTRALLPNGLTILVKENHTAPVAAVLISVKTGYFQEEDRDNGIAHVIEHMLFKGTPRRPAAEQIAREVRELGGYINASTYYEETTYYLTVPAQHVETAMDILTDACRNSLFDAEELAKEIEVIVQESLQKRDNPTSMLYESLYAQTFDRHRIRRWRIGHEETLRGFRREDLLRFVAEYYRPQNMVFTIVGDVSTERVVQTARALWQDLPANRNERALSPIEPPRTDFRYQRINGETKQNLLLFAMPAPPTLHPDTPALMTLSALMSDGRSARLYRRLKEELKVANSAWASYEGFEQMGLFTLGAESLGDDPFPAEQALWDEVRRVQDEPVDASDLSRLKTRIESRRLFGQEEVMGMARTLSNYEQLGDFRLADDFLEQLRNVTPADLQRVARTYLRPEGAALLEYLPKTTSAPPAKLTSELQAELFPVAIPLPLPGATPTDMVQSPPTAENIENRETLLRPASAPPPVVIPATVATPIPADLSTLTASAPQEIALPDGGRLLYRRRSDLPIVALNILFPGSKRRENRQIAGITNLMLKSSLKGTLPTATLPALSAQEIANRVEGLGTGIGQSQGMEYIGYGIKARTTVLEEAFGVLAAVITAPAFAAEEVEKEKQAIYGEIRRQQDNNFSLSYDLWVAARFGETHPYGLPANGIASAIEALTPDDLRRWHDAHTSRSNMVVSVVGDIPLEEVMALLQPLLDALPATSLEIPVESHPLLRADSAEFTETFPITRSLSRAKQQTAAVMGFDGAELANPDRPALDVLNEITSGMGGRLFRAVRGENSLAYQVTSFHRSRPDTGMFVTYTSTASENEQRARDLMLDAIRLLQHEPVSQEELQMAKASILGEHVINMQTFAAQAGEMGVLAVYDLPLDESERYLHRIQQVTAEEAQTVANRYLNTERYWLGVLRGGTIPETPLV